MSTTKQATQQIGTSATASNNFVFSTDGAGALLVQRGTAQAGVVTPLQDLMKFDAAGRLQLLGAPSAFRAHNNGVGQTIPPATITVVNLSTEVYDLNNDFAANAWTPPAGRPVLMEGAVTLLSVSTAAVLATIYKNGAEFARGGRLDLPAGSGASPTLVVTATDIPNGTDVYTLRVFQTGAGPYGTDGSVYNTRFSGVRL